MLATKERRTEGRKGEKRGKEEEDRVWSGCRLNEDDDTRRDDDREQLEEKMARQGVKREKKVSGQGRRVGRSLL